MKKVKLLRHKPSKHPVSVGKSKEYFEQKLKCQSPKLADFFKKVQTRNSETMRASYLVSEMIAKVGAPQTYGEKLVKPAMISCAEALSGKKAASTFKRIPMSRETITRRQDEMADYIESQLVEVLRKQKFALEIDETTIHNQALLLAYVSVIESASKKYIFSMSVAELN